MLIERPTDSVTVWHQFSCWHSECEHEHCLVSATQHLSFVPRYRDVFSLTDSCSCLYAVVNETGLHAPHWSDIWHMLTLPTDTKGINGSYYVATNTRSNSRRLFGIIHKQFHILLFTFSTMSIDAKLSIINHNQHQKLIKTTVSK